MTASPEGAKYQQPYDSTAGHRMEQGHGRRIVTIAPVMPFGAAAAQQLDP